ncbi:MAG: winged helix DNA-binding protein [Sphingomonas sp.]|nr:winged helix DNA-binding protein [Sphingomonas sp.]
MRKRSNAERSISQQLERVKSEVDRLNNMVATFDPDWAVAEVSAERIRGILASRRRREKIFGAGVFGEPGWDILLEVYARKLEGTRATVTEACVATGVAYTTALAWVRRLEREGLITRTADTEDLRRVFVNMSPKATTAMERYFSEMLSPSRC